MLNTRSIKRYKKRYAVRFGIYSPMRLAHTEDISAHGLFIITGNITPVGTRILIDVNLPNNDSISFEGIVRWVKKPTSGLINTANNSGIGVKITHFISGEAEYMKLIASLHARDNVFAPSCEGQPNRSVNSMLKN